MTVLQCGMAKSGNYWVYQIVRALLRVGGVPERSFIQSHLVFQDAQRWQLSAKDQARIDAVAVERGNCYAVISSAFKERIVDLPAYVRSCSHIWTHAPWSRPLEEMFIRAPRRLYIIRDPRDVALSMARFAFSPYYKEYFGTREPDEATYLRHRIYGMTVKWVRHVGGYLMHGLPMGLHVVFYERLLKDPISEVAALAKYLDLTVDDLALRAVTSETGFESMRRQDPAHVRRGRAGDWRNALTDSQQEQVARLAGPMLSLLGYPVRAEHDWPPELDRAIEPRQIARAVRAANGGVWDKVRLGWALIASRRPLWQKVRRGTSFMLGG